MAVQEKSPSIKIVTLAQQWAGQIPEFNPVAFLKEWKNRIRAHVNPPLLQEYLNGRAIKGEPRRLVHPRTKKAAILLQVTNEMLAAYGFAVGPDDLFVGKLDYNSREAEYLTLCNTPEGWNPETWRKPGAAATSCESLHRRGFVEKVGANYVATDLGRLVLSQSVAAKGLQPTIHAKGIDGKPLCMASAKGKLETEEEPATCLRCIAHKNSVTTKTRNGTQLVTTASKSGRVRVTKKVKEAAQ